jgi:hypothetical protein
VSEHPLSSDPAADGAVSDEPERVDPDLARLEVLESDLAALERELRAVDQDAPVELPFDPPVDQAPGPAADHGVTER